MSYPDPTDMPSTDDPAIDTALLVGTVVAAVGATALGVFAAKELTRRRKEEEKECCR